MTRRGRVEALLGRYGEPVVSGGRQARAVLRPMESGGESGRLLYTGPVSLPLTEGGVLTAGGRDCAVLQSGTVRLCGEDLYVRAVLAPPLPSGEGEIRLERGGAAFARARGLSARAVQAAEAQAPWGGGTDAVSPGAVRWEVSLTGVAPEPGADPFSPEEFRVVLEKSGEKTIYGGCRWTSAGEDGGMTLLAARRKKEAAPDG